MNMNLIYSTIVKLFALYDFEKINESLEELKQAADNLETHPENSDYQKEYSDSETNAITLMQCSQELRLTEFDIDLLKAAGLNQMIPGELHNAIKNAQDVSDLTPAVLSQNLEKIVSDFGSLYEKTQGLQNTIKELGAKDIFFYNTAYLAFTLTSEKYDGAYKDFAKAQTDFEKGLRLILNGSNVSDKKIELLALSNTDPMVILCATPPAILLFSKAIQSVLKTIQEGQQIVLLNQQIRTGKLKNQELESMLEQHRENAEKQALSDIASDLTESNDNEKRNSIEKGLGFILKSLAAGNTVEIIVGEYNEEKDSENTEADPNKTKGYLTKQEMQFLEKTSTQLRALKGDEIPQYLLEAPTAKITHNDEEE